MSQDPSTHRLPGALQLVAGVGVILQSACTVISQDAYDFRTGGGDEVVDGGGTDGGSPDGGLADGGTDCPDPLTWYRDSDGDGLGDPDVSEEGCDPPDGYVDNADDCDDSDPEVGTGPTWYLDDDGDGYGTAEQTVEACTLPDGYADQAGDCDDGDDAVNPGAAEDCATPYDDDCDAEPNEQDALSCTEFFLDLDGDGYGTNPIDSQCWCEPHGEYRAAAVGDCDDALLDVNPGATEICFDGVDNDCDGVGCRLSGDWASGEADLIATGPTGARAGERVAFVGDLDADGDTEAAMGAPDGGTGGLTYVVRGPVLGTIGLEFDAHSRLDGQSANDHAGRGLSGLPDIDGDGHPELIIGAPGADVGATDGGAVYIFHGPTAGSASLGAADITLVEDRSYQYAGRGVAGVPDFTGDGVPDIVIGASGDDSAGNQAGVAWVLAGPPTDGVISDLAVAELWGAAAGDQAGRELAAIGDIDGDGLTDVAVGAHFNDDGGSNAGAVYIVLGGATGGASLDDADGTLIGRDATDLAGHAVAGAGDVDGDGTPDLLIGADGRDSAGENAGAAYVVLGPVSGVHPLDDEIELLGEAAGDGAGAAVASAGDLDHDGRAEIIVGAPGSDRLAIDGGAAYLVYGPPADGLDLGSADLVIAGEDGALGSSVAGGADYDGDGEPDIMLGAPDADGTAGQVMIFLGGGL
ncbi:MAG: hypothetical protein D6798_00750 [Deltaproteobacteria bacterium]|nr:MAG: hypothetical protein D6798_00750 [Deltaproteobacteria bacterium]